MKGTVLRHAGAGLGLVFLRIHSTDLLSGRLQAAADWLWHLQKPPGRRAATVLLAVTQPAMKRRADRRSTGGNWLSMGSFLRRSKEGIASQQDLGAAIRRSLPREAARCSTG